MSISRYESSQVFSRVQFDAERLVSMMGRNVGPIGCDLMVEKGNQKVRFLISSRPIAGLAGLRRPPPAPPPPKFQCAKSGWKPTSDFLIIFCDHQITDYRTNAPAHHTN